MTAPASLAVRGATSVCTFSGQGPVRGDARAALEVRERAEVACSGEQIVAVGDDLSEAEQEVDARGCIVLPGFVDPHTHIPFFGWRADEDAARLSGVRYEELHGRSGGIFRSAAMLRDAADDQVLQFARDQARRMLASGTTCFEMKSGYGLSVEAELRQLRLAERLRHMLPQQVETTCLAAHAVPERMSAGEWVGEAAEVLLPAVAEERLAQACDIYVESIAFALEHAARLTEVAVGLGLRMRVHADQLADNQTAAFAARWSFATADHLNHTTAEAAEDLGSSDTVAVLLPGATFTLQQAKRPPARRLVESGAVVALGSDLNPGTSPIASLLLIASLACRLYSLTPVEALAGITVNAAAALGREQHVGRIQPGFRADLLVVELGSVDELAYRPDHNPIQVVVCGGRVAHVAPGAQRRVRHAAPG